MKRTDYLRLLKRKPLNVLVNWNHYRDRKITIVGAGSIGKEILDSLLHFTNSRIHIIDRNEANLFFVLEKHKEFLDRITWELCDYYNVRSRIFDLVIHTAAYKHIALDKNILPYVYNNVTKLYYFIKKNKINELIYLSTDKAANPTTNMGKSKFMAESVIDIYGRKRIPEVRIVRLCNVIGSAGSIVPLIKEKIEKKEDLYLTSENIQRHFITGREAVDLILSQITNPLKLIEDNIEPTKIIDLMKRLKKKNTNIVIGKLRNGEKEIEDLVDYQPLRYSFRNKLLLKASILTTRKSYER